MTSYILIYVVPNKTLTQRFVGKDFFSEMREVLVEKWGVMQRSQQRGPYEVTYHTGLLELNSAEKL